MFFITTTDGDELVMRADAVLGFRTVTVKRCFPRRIEGSTTIATLPPQSFHPTGLNRPPAMDRS